MELALFAGVWVGRACSRFQVGFKSAPHVSILIFFESRATEASYLMVAHRKTEACHTVREHFKPLLEKCLLTSHWPKDLHGHFQGQGVGKYSLPTKKPWQGYEYKILLREGRKY